MNSVNIFQLKKLFFVFGGGIILFMILKPREKKAKEIDRLTMRQNASHALAAYQKAVAEKNTAADLDQLNREIEEMYGLRVYKNQKDGYYYAADMNGNDVLRS